MCSKKNRPAPPIPLLQFNNALCTPLVVSVTKDKYEVRFTDGFDQFVTYADGTPESVINLELLDKPRRQGRYI